MSSTGAIDEHGFINKMLKEGIQMDVITSVKEFIDNSISAQCRNINITLSEKRDFLEIFDDGNGMTREQLGKFVTLCSSNDDRCETQLGYYGVGAKAALINTSMSIEGSTSKILTVSDYNDEDKGWNSVEIDWDKIRDVDDPKVWSNNVRGNNMNRKDSKYWDTKKYRNGTLIQTTIDPSVFSDTVLTSLKFYISKTYNNYLTNSDLTVTFNGEELKGFDVIRYNEIKDKIGDSKKDLDSLEFSEENNHQLEAYCEYKVSRDTNNNYYAEVLETNLEGKEIKREIKSEDFNYNDDGIIIFNHKVLWLSSNDNKTMTQSIREELNTTDSNLLAGAYFTRNNRILSKPIKLDKIRTSQTHTRWRSVTDVSDENIFKLIKLGVNKSELNLSVIDANLFKFLSKITNNIVGACVGFMNNCYKRCDKCKSKPCCCCKNCKKIPNECLCDKCEICRLSLSSCICCSKCNNTPCKCCKICNKLPKNCRCCKNCNNYKKHCKCCKNCKALECICCKICRKDKTSCGCCMKCKKRSNNCICCKDCKLVDCVCFNKCDGCPNIIKECICCKKCKKDCDRCANTRCNKRKCENICNCVEINGVWQTIKDEKLYRDGEEDKYEAVYLIQDGKNWNTNLFKIGKTSNTLNKTNSIRRFTSDSSYNEYSRIICYNEVENYDKVERDLIKEFKKQFSREKQEWFRGDLNRMKQTFLEVIIKNAF